MLPLAKNRPRKMQIDSTGLRVTVSNFVIPSEARNLLLIAARGKRIPRSPQRPRNHNPFIVRKFSGKSFEQEEPEPQPRGKRERGKLQ